MSLVRSLWRVWKPVVAAAVCWVAAEGGALAQKPSPTAEASGEGSWSLAYGLVLLGVVLGMLCVCRQSRRRDRAKPDQMAETKKVAPT